jgi:hypothetical protein
MWKHTQKKWEKAIVIAGTILYMLLILTGSYQGGMEIMKGHTHI